MNTRSFFSPIVLFLAFGATGAAIAEETMEDRCRIYATEDSIPAEEVELYVEECIEILGKEDSDESEGKNAGESEGKNTGESEKKD